MADSAIPGYLEKRSSSEKSKLMRRTTLEKLGNVHNDAAGRVKNLHPHTVRVAGRPLQSEGSNHGAEFRRLRSSI
jgi:hypothetical protein